jgi:hypothetical protein
VSRELPDFTVGECPCDACRFRERCALQRLACKAFSMFMAGANWKHAPRAPTRAIFEAALGHGDLKGGRPRLERAKICAA